MYPPPIKRQGSEGNHAAPACAEVKKNGATPPFPIYLRDIVLNYIVKYKDSFTLNENDF
jgi:hypothetical protein